MSKVIHVLDSKTIDQIAAGEVVANPYSVVKELVENSIDSGADKITVEIKDGGISLIRITDNGIGIAIEDLSTALLRHATSKIQSATDLNSISSLGFRGEALSSICAVSQMQIVTKQHDSFIGARIIASGGTINTPEELGAPDGTTVIVKNLFYNTPARKKFLKSNSTEALYINELIQHLALSHPHIAFTMIQNNQTKFFTSLNGSLLDVIYRIYGKEVAKNVIPIEIDKGNFQIRGYIGKPFIAQANRSNELFFVNGRSVKSTILSNAIELGYHSYLMKHRFPFAVISLTIDANCIDVNIHPSKMEIRINEPTEICDALTNCIKESLQEKTLIPTYQDVIKKEKNQPQVVNEKIPEPFETRQVVVSNENIPKVIGNIDKTPSQKIHNIIKEDSPTIKNVEQLSLFQNHFLKEEKIKSDIQILGQVFQTYWIVSIEDKIYFVDQHAAHEKIKFEQYFKRIIEEDIKTQALLPALVVTLNTKEIHFLLEYQQYFQKAGFVFESFGGNEIQIREVPTLFYGYDYKNIFLDMVSEILAKGAKTEPEVLYQKIASLSCKAAVKGNQKISIEEARKLMEDLFQLENPYFCPHGRPTMFSMTQKELEKNFKRIV